MARSRMIRAAATAMARAVRMAPPMTPEPSSAPARVLVVDDLPENREILTGLLEMEGHLLDTACDGQEAVEKALAAPPDLILMDVAMPRLTGFEACRKLKADERTRLVPIVLVTGMVARADRIEGIA